MMKKKKQRDGKNLFFFSIDTSSEYMRTLDIPY